jgi:branched-chain amino acid transport system substrate-binding protein
MLAASVVAAPQISAAATTSGTCTTGGSSGPGITKSTILLGNSTVSTGEAGFVGQEDNVGIQTVLNAVNAAGGIQGRKLNLVSYDDTYDTSKAQANARRLVESTHIFAWVGGNGTPTLLAALPYLESQALPIVADYGPSDSIGTLANPYLFNPWTNFTQEYENVTNYIIQHKGAGKAGAPMAFLRYNVSLGQDALTGTQDALNKYGLKLVSSQQTTTTNTDWASVALSLKKTGAKWVGIQISETQGGELLQAMHKIGYFPTVFGESDYSDSGFPTAFGKATVNGFYAALQTRLPTDPYPLWQKVQAAFKKATGKTMTVWNAIGEVQALVAVQALKTMKAPTQPCLIDALQNIHHFDTGIIPPITFSPTTRQGVTAVGVGQWKNGVLVQVAPFKTF